MTTCGRAAIIALSAAALCACNAFRTPYVRPPVTMPITYTHADTAARASPDRWWEAYGDEHLNELVAEALRVNPDLALAALNIRAAFYQTHLVALNPAVSVGYTDDYSRPLNNSVPATRFHSLTGSASYEIDLWGELSAEHDVARWEARATVEDRESAALLLEGSVVNLYFEIGELNREIAVADLNLAGSRRTLHLTQVLQSAGGATALDVAASEQAIEGLKATQADLIEQRVERRNALTVLLAGTPWPEENERAALPDGPPPAVNAGLPATLLDRRPDLRAAEQRLREALAQSDATRLSFYPNLALTGSVGTAASGLSELVSNPLGSLAATITAPFVQWNQIHFATALARTQYEEAVLRFQKLLWQALADVDNALSARTQLAAQATSLERFSSNATRIEQLIEARYRAGAVSLQVLLDAQQSSRQAELVLSSNRLARLQNYATLCQALGGGVAEHVAEFNSNLIRAGGSAGRTGSASKG